MSELRVLHWNIHSWRDESGHSNVVRVADLIIATKPDVVSLVEVNEPVIGPSPLQRVASTAGYQSVFVPAFEYGTDGPDGQFGNAILSRLPLLHVRHHDLIWPPRTYDGTEPSEQRSLVLGRVQGETLPIWIGATHLPASDAVARDNAARLAVSVMSALPPPWLLVGDFNMDPEVWRRGRPFVSAYPEAPMPTYPASSPSACIDYCLAPPGQQIRVGSLDSAGSDHLPILVEIGAPGSR